MYSEEMFLDTLLWQFTPTILMTLFYSILLWIAGEHRFNPLSSSSARTSILWGLRLEFLSEPLEIGLIKCLTLSEYWLQHPSSTHSVEADHHTSTYTYVSSVPNPRPLSLPLPASLSYTLQFQTPNCTHCHSGILPPPLISPSLVHAHCLSKEEHRLRDSPRINGGQQFSVLARPAL